jgi:hypothetical protein
MVPAGSLPDVELELVVEVELDALEETGVAARAASFVRAAAPASRAASIPAAGGGACDGLELVLVVDDEEPVVVAGQLPATGAVEVDVLELLDGLEPVRQGGPALAPIPWMYAFHVRPSAMNCSGRLSVESG